MSRHPSALNARVTEACDARGLSPRAWSLRAGFSAHYMAVLCIRAAKDPEFLLPEDAAIKFASVARVSVAWLRFGRGAMDPPPVVPALRRQVMEQLARASADLLAAGDLVAARRVLACTQELAALDEDPKPVG